MYNDKIIITYNFTSLTPIKTRDTMLKDVKEVEFEIKRQLDTAIKNDNVSYKNSCLPPLERHTKHLEISVSYFFLHECGTACVNFMNDKMIIGGVATSLKYRGKGYGKFALEKVLHTVNSNCYLFVCNPIALNMYKSMGFYTICTWDRVL